MANKLTNKCYKSGADQSLHKGTCGIAQNQLNKNDTNYCTQKPLTVDIATIFDTNNTDVESKLSTNSI